MSGLEPEHLFSEAHVLGFDGRKKVHPRTQTRVGVLLNQAEPVVGFGCPGIWQEADSVYQPRPWPQ